MGTRLSAALCGVATIIACLSAATAKSANLLRHPASVKKTVSREARHPAAPAAQKSDLAPERIFTAGKAPFLCAQAPLSFAERFPSAQLFAQSSQAVQPKLDAMGNPVAPIFGAASMYNPYRFGYQEGGIETASGELYDPAAWTAAIQTGLRAIFGGVRYGKDYRPAYALVESEEKQVIVKINDVGPLLPGRVIDLNQQTMYYFDPSLQRGLLRDIKITPLPGQGWVTGPVEGPTLITRAEQTAEPSFY